MAFINCYWEKRYLKSSKMVSIGTDLFIQKMSAIVLHYEFDTDDPLCELLETYANNV